MPIHLGPNSYITENDCRLYHKAGDVFVGSYTCISRGCLFLAGPETKHRSVINRRCVANFCFVPDAVNRSIHIGSDVWIGARAIILPDVTIGDGAIIGAGAVVTRNIPPYAVAVGSPAKVVHYRFEPQIIAALLRIRWWDWPRQKIDSSLCYMEDVGDFVLRYDPLPQDTEPFLGGAD